MLEVNILVKVYGHHINGKQIKSDSKNTFSSLNPSTEQVLAKFQSGTKNDVNKAVAAASSSYKKWSSIPAPKRGEILLEIASILKKRKQQLGKLESTEMGKILQEGLGDVQEAIDIFEYMAGEGRRLFGYTTPSELSHKACYTIRQPLGVVGLITPWNFPIAIPAWKIAPALICGNSIVFKPSSDTPMCAFELVKACEEAGVPKGVINIVTGSGSEVGTEIIKHPKIRGVSFTGSRAVGEFVTKNAGLKKVGLELGGKNPITIMDDADLILALEGVIFGAFGTTGQRCTAASRVIIHKDIFKEFEEKLLKATKKLKVGNPLSSSTNIGPLINKAAQEKTHKYTEIGKQQKARLLCGGEALNTKGFFYKPTIFTNVKPNMRIAQEEIFGPTTALIKVNNLKEAINICNGVDYGLSASIYTNDITNSYLFIEKAESGITYVNAPTIGAEVHLPFGGVKNTGNGTREAGIEGIHEFSETKTVYIDYSNRLQKAQGIK
jgi:alpha-ketoglutaric semialdehyde dehydrogenase